MKRYIDLNKEENKKYHAKAQICNTTKNLHAHHPNYSKPKQIMTLCATHHVIMHSK